MKQFKKAAGALAVLTIATIAMTGCDSDEKPVEPASSSIDESSKPDPGDRYGDVSGPTIDDIEGTRYSAAQDIGGPGHSAPTINGPWLETWIVSKNGSNFAYLQENCAGQLKLRAIGTIRDGLVYWPVPGQIDPWPDGQDASSTDVEISDTQLSTSATSAGTATTDIDAEKKEFADYCKARGQDAADVFTS